MGKFLIGFENFATSTTVATAAKIIGASGKTIEVVEIGMYGTGIAAAADVQHECQFGFLSNATAGTPGASPTPEKMSQGGSASGLTAGTKYSAEPTAYNTNVVPLFSFNQRGGMRWAVPQGEGFKTNGSQTALSAGVRVDASGVGAVDGNTMWWET